jgi:hypothetical protein
MVRVKVENGVPMIVYEAFELVMVLRFSELRVLLSRMQDGPSFSIGGQFVVGTVYF